MVQVTIPLPVYLKMLKRPRTWIIKMLLASITDALGLKDETEDEDMEDQDSNLEGHLDPPEAD